MDIILFYCYDFKSTLQVKITASVSILLSAFWKDFLNLQVKNKILLLHSELSNASCKAELHAGACEHLFASSA